MTNTKNYFDQCVYDIVKDTVNKNNHKYYYNFLKILVENSPEKTLTAKIDTEVSRIKSALREIANKNQYNPDGTMKPISKIQSTAYADLKRIDKDAFKVIDSFYK